MGEFDIIVFTPAGIELDDDDTPFNPLISRVQNIGKHLEEFTVHQRYRADRENAHSRTQLSTTSRIFWFTFLETILLLFVSIAQVYYVRRFFVNKKDLV